jgi:hypothetical protein
MDENGDNDFRLDIAEEVSERLDARTVGRLSNSLFASQLACVICKGDIAPGHDQRAAVICFCDYDERTVLCQLAHASCSPSQIISVDLPHAALLEAIDALGRDPGDKIGDWILGLRRHRVASAVLVSENLQPLVSTHDGGDLTAAFLTERGFFTTDRRLDSLNPGQASGFLLEIDRDAMYLRGPEGFGETYRHLRSSAPEGWFEAIEETGKCLVVFGIGLGLANLDADRLDAALGRGEAVAATVGVQIDWLPEPVSKRQKWFRALRRRLPAGRMR